MREAAVMDVVDRIEKDPVTGLFGFRLEMGRGPDGVRLQARRSGFATRRAAQGEYRRLCRQRDSRVARLRLTGTVQALCENWLQAREQELEPNTLHNYRWLLGLIYPHVGSVRVSRLTAHAVEGAYRHLEAAGLSRTTLRTLDLVLSKAYVEQTGHQLGTRKPRPADELHPVWTLDEARQFLDHVRGDRLYALWRLLLVTGLRRGELCGLKWIDLDTVLGRLQICRQRVVEEPSSRVREKRPKSENGERKVILDEETFGLLLCEGRVDVGVHVHWADGPAVAAGQPDGPVQPARRQGRGAADRAASDPAHAGGEPARSGL
jgi:integrase